MAAPAARYHLSVALSSQNSIRVPAAGHCMSVPEYLLDAPTEKGAFGAVTDRTLAGIRLLLSLSAFLIILIDPTEPSRFRNLTYAGLVGYILYSFAIYLFARHYTNFRW